MDAIKFMLMMFTTLLLIGWFWAWYTFESEPGEIVYPPYGISRCPDLWIYDPDTQVCKSTEYNEAGDRSVSEFNPSSHITACEKMDWLKSFNQPMTWDGLYNDGKYNSYLETCCKSNEPESCGM